jgi:hypothetical protein
MSMIDQEVVDLDMQVEWEKTAAAHADLAAIVEHMNVVDRAQVVPW